MYDGFAIYLIEDGIQGVDILQEDWTDFNLEETPILSEEDIISYTWETHEIELTTDAYERIQELFTPPVPVTGVPFVVMVDGIKIYAGAFWTPLSSLSFDGVTIMHPMDPEGQSIRVNLGYPGDDFFAGRDPRSDERIRRALESAGKLK